MGCSNDCFVFRCQLVKVDGYASFIKSTVVLDDDCWIGAGAILLPGITVGKMAIVGAGSVVTKDVTDNSVVAGVPARIIKKQSE